MRFLIAAVLCLLLSARAGFARDGATDISGVDAAAVGAYMPPPEYPRAARAGRVTGTGIIRLRVHISSGLVTHADIEKSTGSALLDQSGLSALRKWRFKPHALRLLLAKSDPKDRSSEVTVRIPLIFSM